MDTPQMGLREARRLGLLEAAHHGEVTNVQVAHALGLSVRQIRRLRRKLERGGARALIHGNRGRRSERRLAESVHARVVELLQDPEAELNDTHLADVVAEDGGTVSADSVRRIRLALGLSARQRHRPVQHRSRRERRARTGSMLLVDGSPFAWLGAEQPEYTLVGAIDDASGSILSLVFRPEEDLHGYATVFRDVFTRFGLPVSIYGDRTGILRRNDAHWSLQEQLAGRQRLPHGGRMLEALGVGYIPAQSPQAKGRIERLWRTLQDRFVQELRLRRVRTLADAEHFLPRFITTFNRRFAKPPRERPAAWRATPRHLDRELACCYARVVRNDNVVTLPGRWLQIPPGPGRRSYQGCTVELRELLDGRLLAIHQGRIIAEQPAPAAGFTLVPRTHRWRERRRASELRVVDVPIPAPPRRPPRPQLPPPPERPRWRPSDQHPLKRLAHPEALDPHTPNRTRTKSLRS
jgi:transposase